MLKILFYKKNNISVKEVIVQVNIDFEDFYLFLRKIMWQVKKEIDECFDKYEKNLITNNKKSENEIN